MRKTPLLILTGLVLSIFALGFASAYGYNSFQPYENTDVEKYYKKTTNYDYYPGGYTKTTNRFTTTTKSYSFPNYYFPRTQPSYSYAQSNYGFGSLPSYNRYNYPRERYSDNYYYKPIRHPSGSYYWRY